MAETPEALTGLCAQAFDHWNAGRGDAARTLFDQVLARDPSHPLALEGLAVIAVFNGDGAQARALIGQVLAQGPARLETRLNFADILHRAGAQDEALALVEGILGEQNLPAAHYLKGQILWSLGRLDEAFAAYGKARLDLAPELAGYLEYLCQERLSDCDWRGYDAQAAFIRTRIRTGQPLFQPMTPLLMLDSPADLLQAAKIISRRYPPRPALWTGETWAHQRIRIGYLTAELYDHPVGNLMAGPLEHYDPSAFELIAFSYGPADGDPVRRRLLAAFDRVHEVAHLDDAGIARLIRQSEIDVLLHLNGHTRDARPGVLAHRPAPVQVNYQGYPGTLGGAYADYLVADHHVIPDGQETYYAEQVVRMPHTYQPIDDAAAMGPTPTRAEAGLPPDAFVLMAYNNPNKIAPGSFAAWMNILRRVENAVLWLPEGREATRGNLRREAAARGIDPDRLVFAPRTQDRRDHLARHRLADLFLDTLPFNAHSTASDALWAGLPVISCRGTAFAGRVCAGLLTVAGLPDLVTDTLQAYEDLAVALAADPRRLAELRRRVETEVRQSPLFDTARYTRNLETAWRTMHERRLAGQRPAGFAVRDSAGFTPD